MKKLFIALFIAIFSVSGAVVFTGCSPKIHITIKYENADKFEPVSSFSMDMFSGMEINWLYGDVTIICTDGRSSAEVREEVVRGKYVEETCMHVNKESEYGISIEYGANDFLYTGQVLKNLILEIPFLYYNTVKINIVSGNLYTKYLKVIGYTASLSDGDLKMEYSEINHIDITCKKGTVDLDINAYLTECNVVCGQKDLNMVTDLCPEKMSLSTTSGNITLTLPWDTQFRAVFKTDSGTFNTNFDCHQSKNYYYCGDDKNKIDITTTVGNATIKHILD